MQKTETRGWQLNIASRSDCNKGKTEKNTYLQWHERVTGKELWSWDINEVSQKYRIVWGHKVSHGEDLGEGKWLAVSANDKLNSILLSQKSLTLRKQIK